MTLPLTQDCQGDLVLPSIAKHCGKGRKEKKVLSKKKCKDFTSETCWRWKRKFLQFICSVAPILKEKTNAKTKSNNSTLRLLCVNLNYCLKIFHGINYIYTVYLFSIRMFQWPPQGAICSRCTYYDWVFNAWLVIGIVWTFQIIVNSWV